MPLGNGLRTLSLAVLFSIGIAYGQSGLVCAASAGATTARVEGLAEQLGDILFKCSGGNPGVVVSGHLTVVFNVNVTNRLSGNSLTDVVLTVDTGSGPTPTGVPAVAYQSNGMDFNGFTFTVPASGQVALRISNARGDVNQLGPDQSVTAQVSLNLGGPPLSNSRFVVALTHSGLLSTFSSEGVRCTGSPLPSSINMDNLFAAGTRFFSTRVTEGFAEAFQKVDAFSDTGTRIMVQYSGFPAGLRLFVPDAVAGSSAVEPTAGGDLGVPASGGQYAASVAGSLLLVRVNGTDSDGAGGTLAFTPPASGTAALNSASEVHLTNGAGTVVYEVVDSNLFVRETAQFPTFIGLPHYSGPTVIAQMSLSLAPLSTLAVASEDAPIPRFVEVTPPSDCTALNDCNESYFPHLVVTAPSLDFTTPAGGFLRRAYIQVRNSGGGVMNWTASAAYMSGSGWLTMVPSSGVNNGTIWLDAHPDGLSPGTYQAVFTVDGGLMAGSRSLDVTFTVTPAVPSAPAVSGVVNGASLLPGIASAAWVDIEGTNLASTKRMWQDSDFSGAQLPTQLDGVSVKINGKPAYVYYISPAQINVLAPDDATEGTVSVEVTTPDGTSEPVDAQKAAFAPEFFLFDAGGRKYVAAVYTGGTYVGEPNLMPGLSSRPAKAGDVIQLFATGFGPTNPPLPTGELVTQPAQLANPVTVWIGGVLAHVEWAGLVSSGVYQLNVTVPDVPDGDQLVTAEIGGVTSQGESYITVEQ